MCIYIIHIFKYIYVTFWVYRPQFQLGQGNYQHGKVRIRLRKLRDELCRLWLASFYSHWIGSSMIPFHKWLHDLKSSNVENPIINEILE